MALRDNSVLYTLEGVYCPSVYRWCCCVQSLEHLLCRLQIQLLTSWTECVARLRPILHQMIVSTSSNILTQWVRISSLSLKFIYSCLSGCLSFSFYFSVWRFLSMSLSLSLSLALSLSQLIVRRPGSGMAVLRRHINCRKYYYYILSLSIWRSLSVFLSLSFYSCLFVSLSVCLFVCHSLSQRLCFLLYLCLSLTCCDCLAHSLSLSVCLSFIVTVSTCLCLCFSVSLFSCPFAVLYCPWLSPTVLSSSVELP